MLSRYPEGTTPAFWVKDSQLVGTPMIGKRMAVAFPTEVLIDLLGMFPVKEGFIPQNLPLKQIQAWIVPQVYPEPPAYTPFACLPLLD